MSTMQKAINYADALQNANKIIETFQKPVDSKTSLDGLDATIAAISLAATGAAIIASAQNSGKTGVAQVGAAISTGAAFQLNGAVASASLASVACVATVFSTRQSKTPNTENQAQERPSEWR